MQAFLKHHDLDQQPQYTYPDGDVKEWPVEKGKRQQGIEPELRQREQPQQRFVFELIMLAGGKMTGLLPEPGVPGVFGLRIGKSFLINDHRSIPATCGGIDEQVIISRRDMLVRQECLVAEEQ